MASEFELALLPRLCAILVLAGGVLVLHRQPIWVALLSCLTWLAVRIHCDIVRRLQNG